MHFLTDTGLFAFPLLACSLLAAFVIVERLLAFRQSKIFPSWLVPYVQGKAQPDTSVESPLTHSAAGRIIHYYYSQLPDSDTLKAYVNLEIRRLERGLNWLDLIIGVAPFLGLLGTVAGLVSVFGAFNTMPTDSQAINNNLFFASGIALALSTTLCGLAIAIPTMIGNTYLSRRVDILEAKLYLLAEQLAALSVTSAPGLSAPNSGREGSFIYSNS